jgi:hypothetical protein
MSTITITHCSTNMKYVHCPGNKKIICIPHWAGQKSLPVTHFSCCFKFAHNVHLLSYIDSIILTLTVGAVVIVIVLIVGFTTTCAISAYHHKSCEFEPPPVHGEMYSIKQQEKWVTGKLFCPAQWGIQIIFLFPGQCTYFIFVLQCHICKIC